MGNGDQRDERPYAIVVLGAAVERPGLPSEPLRARLDAAHAAFVEARAPRLIVTGRGEATTMARYLVGRGVPDAAILLEEHARSTRENARFVARMVPLHARLVLVTQASHLERAVPLFAAHGLLVEALAAEERWGIYHRVRERVALAHHRLMGWI